MAITKVINDLIDLNATDATKSLKMPSGAAYSGTAQDGMVRNDTDGDSQGSASTMQHFNGTDWKNYENIAPPPALVVDFLVVAGGGGAGGFNNGGGGGAGGYRTTFGTVSPITLNGGSMETALTLSTGVSYNVSIGLGGAGGDGSSSPGLDGLDGQNSLFGPPSSEVIATGAGGGSANSNTANTGGSGGGGGYNGGSGAIAVTSPVIQGFSGGRLSGGSATGPNYDAGGGGGAAEAGDSDGNAYGGDGLENQITGATGIFYAGGGGGGTNAAAARPGGDGGGGAGGRFNGASPTLPVSGTINTGGGGGGATYTTNTPTLNGAAGGSGVVILRYPTASVSSHAVTGTLDTTADTAYPIANTAYYKLEGGSGTTVTDSSGNGNNGVSTSVTYAAGRFGQAAVFNGSSSFVALPFFNFVSGSSANFTASLWFNVTDMSASNNLIQLSGSSATNSSFNVQLLSDGTFRIDSYGVGYAFTGLATVSTNNWYNLVLVNAGGTCTPYLNGSAGNVLTHNIGFSGSYSNLGARYVLGSLYTLDITTGSIDQVRIFNSAISAGNVTSLYNESTVIPSTDGTDSILQFIGGTGTVTFS